MASYLLHTTLGFLLLLLSGVTEGAETPAARAKRIYSDAQQKWQQHTNDLAAACHFARACYDLAEFASKSSERAARAEQGIAVCRYVIATDPTNAPGHYFLVLNLGQLAQTKSFGALKLVDEMEKLLKTCITLDPNFDYGGPHRTIGLLYAEAPGWPISVGNRAVAEQQLLKAVELNPGYPGNQIALAEFYLKIDNRVQANDRFDIASKILPGAREVFRGEEWELSWQEWDQRWAKLKAKLRKD